MNDFKWLAIAIIGIAMGAAISGSVSSYSKAMEASAAMQCGYKQIELDSGKLVWQPSEEEER